MLLHTEELQTQLSAADPGSPCFMTPYSLGEGKEALGYGLITGQGV